MIISINNPILATQIFIVILITVFLFTLRQKKNPGSFSKAVTQELKGFAILAIVFAHIGYYLVNDQRFLFPLTSAIGVGVNLFLFLSGYGLVISALTKPLSIAQFYKRRLLKLYQPLWLVIFIFLGLDFLVGGRTYSFTYVIQSLLGFFPRADITLDINSPLWYFTLIVFYYLLFPLFFSKKNTWLSAVALYLAGFLLIAVRPESLDSVWRLYRIHTLAFPLGVLIGSLVFKYRNSQLNTSLDKIWQIIRRRSFLNKIGYWLLVVFLTSLFVYTAYHSQTGELPWKEEGTSLLACGALILLFLIKKHESRLLYWFGFYSYEIYLLHWPILSRFDIFYTFMPAWLATALYLAFFIVSAWVMQWLIGQGRFLLSQYLKRILKRKTVLGTHIWRF